jgi:hypothetical protein
MVIHVCMKVQGCPCSYDQDCVAKKTYLGGHNGVICTSRNIVQGFGQFKNVLPIMKQHGNPLIRFMVINFCLL